MRNTPYNFTKPTPAAPTETATVTKKTYADSVVRDLSSEIARPTAPPPPPPPKIEEAPPPPSPLKGEQTAEQPEATESAKLTQDFRKFSDKFKEEGEKAIADPKRAAKTTLKFLNFVRVIGLPFLQKWMCFEANERASLQTILSKAEIAERAKKEPDFDPFEKRVYDKWKGLEEHKKGNRWTDPEMDFLVEVGHLQMAESKFIKTLMENEFLLAILYLEGQRIAPVVTARMGMGFVDLGFMKELL